MAEHRQEEWATDPRSVPGGVTNVKVVLTVEIDRHAWSERFGPVVISESEDVRCYIGGLVVCSEATLSGVIVGVA